MAGSEWTAIDDAEIVAGQPVDEDLTFALRDNDKFVRNTSEVLMWVRIGMGF